MTNQDDLKKLVARQAVQFVEVGMILGVGTGTTVNFFIDELAKIRGKIDGAIASSIQTENRLKMAGILTYDLNSVSELPLYIDGCDEFNEHRYLIKGGGGALTREKIIATMAQQFICMADESKRVSVLGKFPVALEVIPMARSMVARQVVQMGGDPIYRQDFVTDNGNVILDIHNLDLSDPVSMETKLKQITGVVESGLFAHRKADKLLIGTSSGIKTLG